MYLNEWRCALGLIGGEKGGVRASRMMEGPRVGCRRKSKTELKTHGNGRSGPAKIYFLPFIQARLAKGIQGLRDFYDQCGESA